MEFIFVNCTAISPVKNVKIHGRVHMPGRGKHKGVADATEKTCPGNQRG